MARGTDFVVALESALRIHEFSTATPHVLWIAMRRGARTPKVDFPLKIVRWKSVHPVDGRFQLPTDDGC